MNFVKVCLFALISGISASTNANSEKHLTMFTWSLFLDPIIYTSKHTQNLSDINEHDGIVAEVLKSFSNEFSQTITVKLISRKRGELELYLGNVDFTIISPNWLEHPEK